MSTTRLHLWLVRCGSVRTIGAFTRLMANTGGRMHLYDCEQLEGVGQVGGLDEWPSVRVVQGPAPFLSSASVGGSECAPDTLTWHATGSPTNEIGFTGNRLTDTDAVADTVHGNDRCETINPTRASAGCDSSAHGCIRHTHANSPVDSVSRVLSRINRSSAGRLAMVPTSIHTRWAEWGRSGQPSRYETNDPPDALAQHADSPNWSTSGEVPENKASSYAANTRRMHRVVMCGADHRDTEDEYHADRGDISKDLFAWSCVFGPEMGIPAVIERISQTPDALGDVSAECGGAVPSSPSAGGTDVCGEVTTEARHTSGSEDTSIADISFVCGVDADGQLKDDPGLSVEESKALFPSYTELVKLSIRSHAPNMGVTLSADAALAPYLAGVYANTQ